MAGNKVVSDRFPVRFMQKGKPGDKGEQGSTGPWLNPAGLWVSGRIYYNNDSYIDVVIEMVQNVPQYYKLRDYYNGVRQTEYVSSVAPSADSARWEQANRMQFLATMAIIAGSGYIDVLGTGSLFVGEQNRAANLLNGWLMTAGAIKHRGTGLELTKEGYINDPDGLHFRVGGKSLASNIPEWAGMANISPFVANGTSMDYVASNIGNIAPKGTALFRMRNTSSSSISITAQFSNGNMIKLKPNTTYTFSIWAAASAARTLYTYVYLHTSQDTTSAHNSVGAVKNLTTTEQQFDYTFTTDDEHLWLNFYMSTVTSPLAAGAYMLITGLSLIEGSVAPTAWQAPGETLTSHIEQGLLQCGIDIDEKKIRLIADMLECVNLRGKKTAWLDDVGNFCLAGVVNSMVMTVNVATGLNSHVVLQCDTSREVAGETEDLVGNLPSSMVLSEGHFNTLDVLRCPNILILNNVGTDHIILPHYISGAYYARTKTKYGGTEHLITKEELQSMVGRKITIFFNTAGTNTAYFYASPQVTGVYGTAEHALISGSTMVVTDFNTQSSFQLGVNDYAVTLEFVCAEMCDFWYDGSGGEHDDNYRKVYYWRFLTGHTVAHNLPDWN